MSDEKYWEAGLRSASQARDTAAEYHRAALRQLNDFVRAARANGVPATRIAECIGTSRQRVYEILREG